MSAVSPHEESMACRCPNCDHLRDMLAIGLASNLSLGKADLAAHGVEPSAARLALSASARRNLKRYAVERRHAWRPTPAEFEAALERALTLLFP